MYESREFLIQRLREDLFGPRKGPHERYLKNETPHMLYSLGVLYPRQVVSDESQLQTTEIDSDSSTELSDDSPLAPMLQKKPASAGFTFAVTPDSVLKITVRGAAYNFDENSEEWFRIKIPTESYVLSEESTLRFDVLNDLDPATGAVRRRRAELRIRWRTVHSKQLVTVTLINLMKTSTEDGVRRVEPQDCLFQVELDAKCVQGSFAPPPSPSFAVDAEEEELQLRYRDRVQWASGHNCSASWSGCEDPGSVPNQIKLDFLPVAYVHKFLPDRPSEATYARDTLRIARLSEPMQQSELVAVLEPFVADFQSWLDKSKKITVSPDFQEARDRIVRRLTIQSERLEKGLALFQKGDEKVLKAFALANQAILDQMELSAARKGKAFNRDSAMWRPFQLAFQLLTIPGVVDNEGDGDRDILDLIWFPTGGGKTEAYLLLTAFTVIFRRLTDPTLGSGTAVISRYTLRLLTADQFIRTSTLICSLELMRKQGLIPGSEAITLGLWIGGGDNSCPNKFKEALRRGKHQLESERPINPFMLKECPCCGTKIVPERNTGNPNDFGFRATETSFELYCPNSKCEFHDRLPIQVVDEALYESPPSVLLGTIDKFARMAWDHRSRSFLGWTNSGRRSPPDLVIQDELHLISGPLGSIAALYEAALDVALDFAGKRPKYVAATATIRGAATQVKNLYARDVAIFPAPGLSSDDSYYMREDKDIARSRAYLGYMGQGHTPVICGLHVMASALQGAMVATPEDDFWTLAVYHNSKRELGKTMKLARDSAPMRIQQVLYRENEELRTELNVSELSANIKGDRLPEALSALNVRRRETGSIDLVACTNMISVGVDISRLNLMVVQSQPKTAAEYIQATSRVGRSPGSAGLVIASLSASRPRDRAHYESFMAFHSGYYRWVEPSSVTPDSPGACDRALHAAIVIAVRLSMLPDNNSAGQFSKESCSEVLSALRARLLASVNPELQPAVEHRFDELTEWWEKAAKKYAGQLRYSGSGQFPRLLENFGSACEYPSKATLNSMRNVEQELAFSLKKYVRQS